MSLQVAGLYLRTLRERQGLSRSDLVFELRKRKLTLDERQLARIEAGEIDTRSSLLLGITTVLRGSYERVAELILNEAADEDLVQKYVAEWEQQRQTLISSEQEADLVQLQERLHELSSDPRKLLAFIRESWREET
jgi:transcriptional regulator with XRE-family HTH domain